MVTVTIEGSENVFRFLVSQALFVQSVRSSIAALDDIQEFATEVKGVCASIAEQVGFEIVPPREVEPEPEDE